MPLTGGTPTVLASFDGTDGSNSTGYGTHELILSDGTLYGSTSAGGANGAGTFFSLPETGGTPTVLASLGGSSGLVAVRSLIVSGGSLYAATVGAEQPSGEIVSLPITGGTPTVLAYLTRASGQYPGSLVLSRSTLFCSTTEEGPFGWGTIFSLPISGGTPAVLASSFGGGGEPQDLVLSNGTLYGATGAGTYIVFSLPVGGGTPTVLSSLDGYPLAPGMVISGGTLYGTSSGFNDDGEVFSLPSLAASSISLTSSHVPVFQGKHVTLTATVSPAGGTSGTPTGTVTFYDGGHAIGIPEPIIDGTASFTDTTLPIGFDSITAIYSGDANFASATTAAAIIARILPPPPTIVSTTASVSTHGSTIAASVVATDSGPGGAAGLTYTWTTLRMPSGAKMPTFNVNGTNAAQNIIARFSTAGDYILRCEVINASRYIELTDVFVTVSQKATALKIEPHAAHIAKGGTLQFTGTVLDQFNHRMRTAQTLTYLVAAGPGSISSTGLFSAASIAGAVTIELEADDLTAAVGAVVA